MWGRQRLMAPFLSFHSSSSYFDEIPGMNLARLVEAVIIDVVLPVQTLCPGSVASYFLFPLTIPEAQLILSVSLQSPRITGPGAAGPRDDGPSS